MKKIQIILLILIIIGLGLLATQKLWVPKLVSAILEREGISQTTEDSQIKNLTYTSEKYGISFEYPETYYLETKELGDANRWHFLITLTEDTEENKLVREGKAGGREGPTAITFDLYQSPETNDALAWVKGHSSSNFKLSDGTFEETTIGGKPAVKYSWDGLYRADNVALSHKDFIASIAVTYLTPEDAIHADFSKILETLKFY